ncbi:hypothetical protein BVRB_1g011830 [Beta vulgaris subsp. vulgaris]|nr:hypothetical protein BVRB_1g011830 [Beta vulgaris subsp. vulgaris]
MKINLLLRFWVETAAIVANEADLTESVAISTQKRNNTFKYYFFNNI